MATLPRLDLIRAAVPHPFQATEARQEHSYFDGTDVNTEYHPSPPTSRQMSSIIGYASVHLGSFYRTLPDSPIGLVELYR